MIIGFTDFFCMIRCPPRIPPDAVLEFEVHLVSFLNSEDGVRNFYLPHF